jgi:replicative DNA helicase
MRNKKQAVNYEEFVYSNALPNIKEIEDVVLGAVMIEGYLIDYVMKDFSKDLFYHEGNKVVAEAVIKCYIDKKPCDPVMVVQKIKELGLEKQLNSDFYVFDLCTKVASSANIEHHIKLLQEAALKRSIIKFCSEAVRGAFDKTKDVFEIYQELQEATESNLKNLLTYDIKDVYSVHEKLIKESIEIVSKGGSSGVPSGLMMVDNVTNGWQKADLIILAGRPSMGKTAAAVSMIMNPSLLKKVPVGIFSLEMSAEQLVGRMQSIISDIDVGKIIRKQLTLNEIDVIKQAGGSLKDAPIYIDDTPNISLIEVKTKCRRMVKEQGVKLILIDYLQLMRSGLNIGNREQEIAEISRGLKGLAKELEIPIIALSQLSRSVEARGGDKKPMLQDLRESGQIEQDADMVMFCYRPEYYDIDQYEVGGRDFDTKGLFMLIIAKHRNGELGEIPLTFVHSQTKLTNYQDSAMNNFTPLPSQQSVTSKESSFNPLYKYEDDDSTPF